VTGAPFSASKNLMDYSGAEGYWNELVEGARLCTEQRNGWNTASTNCDDNGDASSETAH
jgi:hypothetical protein